jgi:HK97 family phage major capsid protein
MYVKNRMPMEAGSLPVQVKNILPIRGATPNMNGLVSLTAEEVKQYRALVETKSAESKAAPVFGTDVIAPSRVDRLVQDLRPDVLTLRDVLNVSPTSSPVIDYIAEVSYTEAAAIVSEGASKPPASTVYEKRRANTVVIAVYIPATEQQLSDAPALINRINNRLTWDVHKAEEQQIGYGNGSGENFDGFFQGTNVAEMRDEAGIRSSTSRAAASPTCSRRATTRTSSGSTRKTGRRWSSPRARTASTSGRSSATR